MKKAVPLLFFGSVFAGIVLLVGVSWVFGVIAKAGAERFSGTEPDPDAPVTWEIDLGEYRRGVFSSEADSKLALGTGATIETTDDDASGIPLRHVVYHGPLAMTPDGLKFCSYHVVTTIRMEDAPASGRDDLEKMFLGKSPLTIRSTTGFGGKRQDRIDIAPIEFKDDAETGTWKFPGGFIEAAADADGTTSRGSFEMGALEGTDIDGPGNRMTIGTLTGEFDYRKGDHFRASLRQEGLTVNDGEIMMDLGESIADFDYVKGMHLNGQIKLGTLNIVEAAADRYLKAGPIVVSADWKRISDTVDLLFGETKFELGQVRVSGEGTEIVMDGVSIRASSGEKDGKLFARMGWDVGSIRSGQNSEQPLPIGPLMGKGIGFETGVQGFDLATIERLVKPSQELAGLDSISGLSDLSDPEVADRIGETPAENSEALSAYTRQVLDLVQPGLEIYAVAEVRGDEGKSGADIRLGMGGEKKLTEMTTLREILSAISGNAIVRIGKQQYPPDELAALIAESESAALIAEHPDRFETAAELAGGRLSVNGEVMPLLDETGPALDEPIDWDAIFAAIAAGGAAEGD